MQKTAPTNKSALQQIKIQRYFKCPALISLIQTEQIVPYNFYCTTLSENVTQCFAPNFYNFLTILVDYVIDITSPSLRVFLSVLHPISSTFHPLLCILLLLFHPPDPNSFPVFYALPRLPVNDIASLSIVIAACPSHVIVCCFCIGNAVM